MAEKTFVSDTMQEKILFVDDEPAVLQGFQRLLRSDFAVDTAVGGKGALIALKTNGPYAVVVSDMRMPGMDGVEFLSAVKSAAPDAIRIMLTGQAGLEAAIDAVNEGNIFRFLTKPCGKELLGKALNAALVQYRLTLAERELLEKTLKASIQVLSEVLSLVNPAAFSRAMRLRRYVSHIVAKLGLPGPWRFEVAAMMSQLGCVTLDDDTIAAVYAQRQLSPEELARYNSHPLVARRLLENIPRMEPIGWMIAHQNQPDTIETDIADREMADMRLGADILRVAVAFDSLSQQGLSRTEAAHRLTKKYKGLDPRIFYSLVELEPEKSELESRNCTIEELSAGMVLDQDIYADSGPLIVARGQDVSFPLILKLKGFYERGSVRGPIRVIVSRRARSVAALPVT